MDDTFALIQLKEIIKQYSNTEYTLTKEEVDEYLEFFHSWDNEEWWSIENSILRPELGKYILCMNLKCILYYLHQGYLDRGDRILIEISVFWNSSNIYENVTVDRYNLMQLLIAFDREYHLNIEKLFVDI